MEIEIFNNIINAFVTFNVFLYWIEVLKSKKTKQNLTDRKLLKKVVYMHIGYVHTYMHKLEKPKLTSTLLWYWTLRFGWMQNAITPWDQLSVMPVCVCLSLSDCSIIDGTDTQGDHRVQEHLREWAHKFISVPVCESEPVFVWQVLTLQCRQVWPCFRNEDTVSVLLPALLEIHRWLF